jgi:hypothetical protein
LSSKKDELCCDANYFLRMPAFLIDYFNPNIIMKCNNSC